jgi:membrane protein DedA with SNARE-associated domain
MILPVVLAVLALLIYIINVIPIFMPPTWTILAFYYINFHPPLLPAIIIGALFATLGRITLYYISKKYFRRFFSAESLENYDALGNFFEKKQKLSIPLFLTYAFFPISSNYVYIAAGLASVNIKILATCFFVGRLISYSFWVSASHIVFTRVEDIFSTHISNISVIILELVGLFIVVLIGKIKWKKILKLKS